MTDRGKIQGKQGPPPIEEVKDLTLGQLWDLIMIKQYLAGQLTGYDIAIQGLAPGIKRTLDNLLGRIDDITARINRIGQEMRSTPNPDKDKEAARQAGLQADLNAAMTERSKVQTEISTTQATMQAVLQRGMSNLQQANSFVQELAQMWNQMSQGLG